LGVARSILVRELFCRRGIQELFIQLAAESLSATISQYFMGGMMPESVNPVLQHQTIIEIRPYRGGWKCFEGPGVERRRYRLRKGAREIWTR